MRKVTAGDVSYTLERSGGGWYRITMQRHQPPSYGWTISVRGFVTALLQFEDFIREAAARLAVKALTKQGDH